MISNIKKICLIGFLFSICCISNALASVENAYDFIYSQLEKCTLELQLVPSYDEPYPTGFFESDAQIYDNALAIMTLLESGKVSDVNKAKSICQSLIWLQDNDPIGGGRIRSVYRVNLSTERDISSVDEVIVKYDVECGNLSWVMMALLRYYTKSNDPDSVFLADVITAATEIGDFIDNNFNDATSGYVVGLFGAPQSPSPSKSTEHNFAAYTAFDTMFSITGDSVWETRRDEARDFIDHMWNGTYYYAGTQSDGWTPDTTFDKQAVDNQAFGMLVFNDPSKNNLLTSWAYNNCSTTDPDSGFVGFDFNTDNDRVWFEGTAQMGLAYNMLDNSERRDFYVDQIRLAQNTALNNNGKGIVSASSSTLTTGYGWNYYASPHIGATCWYIMLEKNINMFWGVEKEFYRKKIDAADWKGLDGTYQSTGTAVAHMIINYMQEQYNNVEDPDVSISSQDEIYTYLFPSPQAPYSALTPNKLHDALEYFDPYGEDLGYNFLIFDYESSEIETYMRDICHWIAYDVPKVFGEPELVAAPNTPVALSINGDPSYWVMVNGCITDIHPCPDSNNPKYQPNFKVFGFWIRDPLGPVDSQIYKSADSCVSTDYFSPLESGPYSGKFVQVSEPPEIKSTADISIAEVKVTDSGKKIIEDTSKTLKKSSVVSRQSYRKLESINWKELLDQQVITDSLVIKTFDDSVPVECLHIKNQQKENSDYYMIYFARNGDINKIVACMLIDAVNGKFIEVALFDQPRKKEFMSPSNVSEIMNTLSGISDSEIELAYKQGFFSRSVYFPYWSVKGDNKEWRIKTNGEVYKNTSETNAWRLIRNSSGKIMKINFVSSAKPVYNDNLLSISLDRAIKEDSIKDNTIKLFLVNDKGEEKSVSGKTEYDKHNHIIYFKSNEKLENYNNYKLVIDGLKDLNDLSMDEYIAVYAKTTIKQQNVVDSKVINYPNPFRAGSEATTISYDLSDDASVTIVIYSSIGNLVKKIEYNPGDNGGRKGSNNITWDGKNGAGFVIGNGMYIVKIYIEKVTGEIVKQTRKIGVVR